MCQYVIARLKIIQSHQNTLYSHTLYRPTSFLSMGPMLAHWWQFLTVNLSCKIDIPLKVIYWIHMGAFLANYFTKIALHANRFKGGPCLTHYLPHNSQKSQWNQYKKNTDPSTPNRNNCIITHMHAANKTALIGYTGLSTNTLNISLIVIIPIS